MLKMQRYGTRGPQASVDGYGAGITGDSHVASGIDRDIATEMESRSVRFYVFCIFLFSGELAPKVGPFPCGACSQRVWVVSICPGLGYGTWVPRRRRLNRFSRAGGLSVDASSRSGGVLLVGRWGAGAARTPYLVRTYLSLTNLQVPFSPASMLLPPS